jgi:hypothetical protein
VAGCKGGHMRPSKPGERLWWSRPGQVHGTGGGRGWIQDMCGSKVVDFAKGTVREKDEIGKIWFVS